MGLAAAHAGGRRRGGHAQLLDQLAPHRIVEALQRNLALLDGAFEAVAPEHAKRHLQVLSGLERGHAISDPEDEIAHHNALKAPALLEDLLQQQRMLAAPGAVHAVVGAHHRTRARLHAGPKLRQKQLMQHAGVDLHIHHEA